MQGLPNAIRRKTSRGPGFFLILFTAIYPQSLKQCLASTEDSINNYWVNEQMNVFPYLVWCPCHPRINSSLSQSICFVSVVLTCLWFLANETFVSGLPLKYFLTTYSVYSFPFTLYNGVPGFLLLGPPWWIFQWRHPSHKKSVIGLPWWRSGWESACQCRRHGFEPWSGRIPHAAEQLGREPQLLSLRVWSLCSAAGEAMKVGGPRTAMKSGPHLPQLEKDLPRNEDPTQP